MKMWILASMLFLASAILSSYITIRRSQFELVVNDQPVGTTIFIQRLVLSRAGYIVITPQTGRPDRDVPSVSDYMPAGVYTDFNADIYWGDELDVPASTLVTVRIHSDNGDVYYDPAFDLPVRDKFGRIYEKTITLQ